MPKGLLLKKPSFYGLAQLGDIIKAQPNISMDLVGGNLKCIHNPPTHTLFFKSHNGTLSNSILDVLVLFSQQESTLTLAQELVYRETPLSATVVHAAAW